LRGQERRINLVLRNVQFRQTVGRRDSISEIDEKQEHANFSSHGLKACAKSNPEQLARERCCNDPCFPIKLSQNAMQSLASLVSLFVENKKIALFLSIHLIELCSVQIERRQQQRRFQGTSKRNHNLHQQKQSDKLRQNNRIDQPLQRQRRAESNLQDSKQKSKPNCLPTRRTNSAIIVNQKTGKDKNRNLSSGQIEFVSSKVDNCKLSRRVGSAPRIEKSLFSSDEHKKSMPISFLVTFASPCAPLVSRRTSLVNARLSAAFFLCVLCLVVEFLSLCNKETINKPCK
jgi:hypothetical protein